MSNLVPCKHLDHNAEDYPGLQLKTCAPHYPDVKYFLRKAPYEGAATKVQFCGAGRGRINGIFDCYQKPGPCNCHE